MHCLYCFSKNTSLYKKVNSFDLIKCNSCNLIQTKILRSNQNLINRKVYSFNYLNDYEKKRSKSLNIFFTNQLKTIEVLTQGGNLLDFGCSIGLFLKTVSNKAKYKWNLYGLDINSRSINRAKEIITANLHNGKINKKTYKRNFFDVITCFDVIEHDFNLYKTLDNLNYILKSKGILIIQVPNLTSIMSKLTKDDWDWLCLPDHVFHFDSKTICKTLENHSFNIIKVITWQPYRDFVENIRGVIKKRITTWLSLNKIIAKLSYLPLSVIWFYLFLTRKYNKSGGLILIIAQKI